MIGIIVGLKIARSFLELVELTLFGVVGSISHV